MKRLLIHFASWALRKVLYASRQLWADLRRQIRTAEFARSPDGQPFPNADKHNAVDLWLAAQPGFDDLPQARKRLIQAAVLSLRLESYFQ